MDYIGCEMDMMGWKYTNWWNVATMPNSWGGRGARRGGNHRKIWVRHRMHDIVYWISDNARERERELRWILGFCLPVDCQSLPEGAGPCRWLCRWGEWWNHSECILLAGGTHPGTHPLNLKKDGRKEKKKKWGKGGKLNAMSKKEGLNRSALFDKKF